MFYLIGSKTSPLKYNLLQNWNLGGENELFKSKGFTQAFATLSTLRSPCKEVQRRGLLTVNLQQWGPASQSPFKYSCGVSRTILRLYLLGYEERFGEK